MRTNHPGRGRLTIPAAALLALLAAGCGSTTAAPGALKPPSRAATAAVPTVPADFPCPGETPGPTPNITLKVEVSASAAPGDHYAENHGFKVPIPLHGQSRCDGLAAAQRVKGALEPLRARHDFTKEGTRGLLTGLGYPAGRVDVQELGAAGVAFTAGDGRLCLSGTMGSGATTVESFAGYPDGTGCEPPRGGH
ncbi:hypothetical protein [Streptomyces sp. Y1]|uniref:Lipoprotein n=1 Tax=Streptomyces sp. Y1 TaxID=3238634 RepID=A0AB39TWH2_9ACTN